MMTLIAAVPARRHQARPSSPVHKTAQHSNAARFRHAVDGQIITRIVRLTCIAPITKTDRGAVAPAGTRHRHRLQSVRKRHFVYFQAGQRFYQRQCR